MFVSQRDERNAAELRRIFEQAVARLPTHARTNAVQVRMAQRMLAMSRKGPAAPDKLIAAALSEAQQCEMGRHG